MNGAEEGGCRGNLKSGGSHPSWTRALACHSHCDVPGPHGFRKSRYKRSLATIDLHRRILSPCRHHMAADVQLLSSKLRNCSSRGKEHPATAFPHYYSHSAQRLPQRDFFPLLCACLARGPGIVLTGSRVQAEHGGFTPLVLM